MFFSLLVSVSLICPHHLHKKWRLIITSINENILKALLTILNSTSSHHTNLISNMIISWIHFVLLFLHLNLVEAFDGDPYKILGVKKSASQSEIKKAYRQKAKEVCVQEWDREYVCVCV
jgi:hypothetical protein